MRMDGPKALPVGWTAWMSWYGAIPLSARWQSAGSAKYRLTTGDEKVNEAASIVAVGSMFVPVIVASAMIAPVTDFAPSCGVWMAPSWIAAPVTAPGDSDVVVTQPVQGTPGAPSLPTVHAVIETEIASRALPIENRFNGSSFLQGPAVLARRGPPTG